MSKYSDDTVAECLVLHESGSSIRAISRARNIPESTIRGWVNKANDSKPPARRPISPILHAEKRDQLADAIVAEIEHILPAMARNREEADYKTLTVALGILTEKYLLLTGQATDTIETRSVVFQWAPQDSPRRDNGTIDG